MIQNNEDNSAGNLQINEGGIRSKALLYAGYGYSFNLQLNIFPCEPGENDKINTFRGNIQVFKCTDSTYFYHNDGDVIYQIISINSFRQSSCSGKFMEIQNGKVHITFCVGYSQ
jgi:hypothetical protein